jgi:tetratricopeptide (TPR) repeat protein
MKNFLLYFSVIVIIASCSSQASDTSNTAVASAPDMTLPELLERKGELAKAAEWEKTKIKVNELKLKATTDPNNIKARIQLATIYIAEARITGEHPHYYPAIHKILDGVLATDPNSFEAMVLKAAVFLSQHKFKEAVDLANRAKAINANEAYVYGILVDGNVELGNYDEAVKNSDKMQSLKPSLESYSRASYLREIYGDQEGAIEAMKMATKAGLPGSEPQCWSMNTLAELYLNSGAIDKAEAQYKEILAIRPSYAFAVAGLAKVEEKRKNYAQAIDYLHDAIAIMPEFSFYDHLGDLYLMTGDKKQAMEKYEEVRLMLLEDQRSGHLVDFEMAKLFMKMDDLATAEKHLQKEYAVRPNNIQVSQEMAWLALKKKDVARAKELIKIATRTGNKDPELLSRAAIINNS